MCNTHQPHVTGILKGFSLDLALDSNISRLRADMKNTFPLNSLKTPTLIKRKAMHQLGTALRNNAVILFSEQ